MRLVADLADAGNVRGAIAILGDRVIESDNRIGDAANAWLALSADQREKTTLLPSSRDGRAEANQIIQDGLKAEGTLQGEGRAFNVRETVQLTREERSEEHTSELQSLMRISYAVFCLQKKKKQI